MHLCYEIMATRCSQSGKPGISARLSYLCAFSLSLSLSFSSSLLPTSLLLLPTILLSTPNVMLQRVSAPLVTRPCLHIPPPRPSLPGTGLLPSKALA